MPQPGSSLAAYVPNLALRVLASTAAGPLSRCRVETLTASVLLADIAGFTALIDRLARDFGPSAAERLQDILNKCFGPLTALVAEAGGEVLSFPGDAALAVWTDGPGAETSLSDLVRRSALCGIALQSTLDRLAVADDVEVRLRVAIGAGRSAAAVVGGVDGHWDVILRGEPIAQLHETLATARPGEVVVSRVVSGEAARVLRGELRDGHLVVSGAVESFAPSIAPAPVVPTEEHVRAFAPRSVLEQIDAGQEAWLSEFRRVTVVFIEVVGLDADDDQSLQRSVSAVQAAVARFEGVVNQIVADEKGLAVVAGFGVARSVHEDAAIRAVRASFAVRDDLRECGVEARIGVASGLSFTGWRGGESRRELAILGSNVVLAARLAETAGDILCDSATRAACRRRIQFESESIKIKGKSARVDVYRPFSLRTGAGLAAGAIVGRQAERGLLEDRVAALERDRRGGVILLEGDAGIGKTTLINHLLEWAQSRAVRCFRGAGDSIEQGTSYLAWRPIVASLLGATVAQERLVELLGAEGRWAPLFNPLVSTRLAENRDTLSLTAETRAALTRQLLAALLDKAAAVNPLLIVLEDAHWIDSASWELAEYVVSHVAGLLLLVSARPRSKGLSSIERLAAHSDFARVQLEPLNHDDVQELVCRHLDVDTIPPEVAALIGRRAEGHPLFAAELALALRDRGSIVIRDGICRLTSESSGVDLPLPDTVHGIVASRIDQLPTHHQLTLKVAAVMGRRFTVASLANVHPVVAGVEALTEQVRLIVETGLLQPTAAADGVLAFSHAVVQEVAYESLPFSQRRDLHRRTAEWIERAPDRHQGDVAPLLAHHWERAEVTAKAMHYLEQAGERALLRDSADREAEDFLSRLVALAETQPTRGEQVMVHVPMLGRLSEQQIKLARWRRLLAQALARRGRHGNALEQLEHSIAHLGQQLPPGRPHLRLRVEFARGLIARLVFNPPAIRTTACDPRARLALLELARSYDTLVDYLYLRRARDAGRNASGLESMVRSIVAVLRSVRAAELAGPCEELSQAYSFLANVVAMFRRDHVASYYANQARAIASQVGGDYALFRALTTGQMPAFIRGRWEESAAALEQAQKIAAELQIVHQGLIYECTLGLVHLNEGRLDTALARFRDVRRRAEQEQALVPQLWAMASMAEVAFRQGRVDETILHADDALELAEQTNTPDQNARFQAHGLLASAWLRREGPERAGPHITKAIAAAEAGASLSFSAQSGFAGVAEGLFAQLEGGPRSTDAADRLRRWLRLMRVMAFCRPILEPWSLIFHASWRRAHGRHRSAIRRLRRAVQLAERMSLPYETGYARLEWARLLSPGDSGRAALLAEAIGTFERIGAAGLLSEARRLHVERARVSE